MQHEEGQVSDTYEIEHPRTPRRQLRYSIEELDLPKSLRLLPGVRCPRTIDCETLFVVKLLDGIHAPSGSLEKRYEAVVNDYYEGFDWF